MSGLISSGKYTGYMAYIAHYHKCYMLPMINEHTDAAMTQYYFERHFMDHWDSRMKDKKPGTPCLWVCNKVDRIILFME